MADHPTPSISFDKQAPTEQRRIDTINFDDQPTWAVSVPSLSPLEKIAMVTEE